jgi:hypothetical protein
VSADGLFSGVEVFSARKEMGYIILSKPAIAPGADSVRLDDTLVAPSSYCVDVDV